MKHLIACAALIVLAGVIAFVHERDRPALRAEENPFALPPDTRIVLPPEAVVASVSERQPLDAGFGPKRRELLHKMRAKIELMDDEQVRQALEQADTEIGELEAAKRLKQATGTLRSIVDELGKTPSATIAREMLAARDRGPVPTPDFPTPTPTRSIPEGNF